MCPTLDLTSELPSCFIPSQLALWIVKGCFLALCHFAFSYRSLGGTGKCLGMIGGVSKQREPTEEFGFLLKMYFSLVVIFPPLFFFP